MTASISERSTRFGYRSGARGAELTAKAMEDAGLGEYPIEVEKVGRWSRLVTASPDVFDLYKQVQTSTRQRKMFPRIGGKVFVEELTKAVEGVKARRTVSR